VRQVRLGVGKETKGTAFVVYEDIWDAKAAQEKLSGFNVRNRYLVVLFHKEAPRRAAGRAEAEAELRELQARHGVDGEQHPEPARGGAR
jgi:pre-mRNA branch site protein p14